ncbi:DNA-binding protein HU-beta/DNA-binding protein HU-alpha [Gemmobacter caeni]|uniref:DNA-binding protein HU-beta/DNA-binding protein HU-alpha n=1 Tax=Gemmobacter caeni TaxID=589035 RepID=A0A2T6B8X0_9RHOB|nr:HU family DNA-binding protein [Gemmobacter caeni]PTX52509.1 DNA-binding protein HU-beta/DNA-binding protein HU-alpha [Gemmobacter caeni]TWJ02820.1 DNA-binding protein HU-beta/DNA-binding protein HU-alpha [Gemmobacter caeni]
MKKSELIASVAEKTGLNRKQAGEVIDVLFAEVARGSADAGGVAIAGFGTFKVKTRPARSARNPATGATIEVPEKRVLNFKPSSALSV